MAKRICVDFDRVVHQYGKGFYDGTVYDEPVEGAVDAIKRLQSEGFEIVILTARSPRGDARNDEVKAWLERYDLGDLLVTNIKPPAVAYIDDRAIRFTNWRDMLSYFV